MLTSEQIKLLEAPLSKANVKKNPRGYDYVEAWHAIAEANRIFGFDAWSRETVLLQETNRDLIDLRGQNGPYQQWRVGYLAKVRITIDGAAREGTGFGSGMAKPEALGEAIESAAKEAESDAMKRALMTFGNPFGLALYDKTQANVVNEGHEAGQTPSRPQQTASNGVKRLSAAQAKERGLDTKIKDQIETCFTRSELAEWDRDFDRHTAEMPTSWLDAIRNHVILRGEEIDREIAGRGMDADFRDTVGPAVFAAHVQDAFPGAQIVSSKDTERANNPPVVA